MRVSLEEGGGGGGRRDGDVGGRVGRCVSVGVKIQLSVHQYY